MFEDQQQLLEDFSDLKESKREEVLKDILAIANQNKERFESYVSSLGFGYGSTRSIFYEAIWDAPKNWENFLLTQIKELIQAAENNIEGAVDELDSIFYLTQVEELASSFYEQATTYLFSKLNSNSAKVRIACIEGISEIKDMENHQLSSAQIKKMQNLLSDENFSVRVETYANLNDFDLVPKEFKFSLLDRLRIRLSGKSYLVK